MRCSAIGRALWRWSRALSCSLPILLEKPKVGIDLRQEVAVAAEHDILFSFDKQLNRLLPAGEGGDDQKRNVLEEDAERRHLLGR